MKIVIVAAFASAMLYLMYMVLSTHGKQEFAKLSPAEQAGYKQAIRTVQADKSPQSDALAMQQIHYYNALAQSRN